MLVKKSKYLEQLLFLPESSLDEVTTQHNNIVGNKTIGTDTEESRGVENGKKRARKEVEYREGTEKKRVKFDEGSSGKTMPKPKVKKGQAYPKATSSIGNSTTFIEPRWNVFQPIKTRTPTEATQSQEKPPLTELKPRIWTNSREELVVLLPDLAGPKCLNGVSWLMYETPMVLLDDSTSCFDIFLHEDAVTLDLLTTREFTCTWPPRSEKVPDPPEILTMDGVPDGTHSNLGATTVTSSSKKLPNMCPIMSIPTTVTAPTTAATGFTNHTQTPPEGATLNDIYIPLPTYTFREPSTHDFKAARSEQKTSQDRLIDFVAPMPTYYSKPVVENVSELSGTNTISFSGPFGDVLMKGGRRIMATGSRKETPEGVSIDFSPPTVPNYTSNKPISGESPHSHSASSQAKVKQILDMKAFQDAFVPSKIPEEIQAVIDSYLSGRPLLLVISNKRFFDYWSLRLPEEFGFSMLGYFRILGVQESRVDLNDPVRLKDSSGSMTGRVKWRFRLRWSPGGEEWILPKHDKNLFEHSWWKPPPLSILPLETHIPTLDTQSTDNLVINHATPGVSQEMPVGESFTPPSVVSNLESQQMGDKDLTELFEPENTFDTTPRYRAARLSNANYQFRHTHLRELYHSHVPLQLLAPYGCKVLDSSFPRGWLCEHCGKMNFQAALRHRACSSSFCKGLKPEIAPYAIELVFMRDPLGNPSMILPYNEPLLIKLVDTWEDGTRTLPYYIHDDENIFIKHIFTRNYPPLQVEATRLLHFLQLEVELVRPIGENSPYFRYSAHAPKGDPSPTTSEWPNVPRCIYHAKDWTQHQAIRFGELKKEQLLINHLCLLAWVSSGTKRGPGIIRAKEKSVVFLAFGCNITVLVTPLSLKATAPIKIDRVGLDSLISMDDLPPDEDVNPSWIAGLDEEDDVVEDPLQEDKECWPATISKKTSKSKCPFLFTLVHGDVLVFYGDDFEYSLKRAGTSLLLIASYQNEPQV